MGRFDIRKKNGNAGMANFLKQSKGTPTYPWSIPADIPKPPNERNSFINCWLVVWGMLQGSVGKFLETRLGEVRDHDWDHDWDQIGIMI